MDKFLSGLSFFDLIAVTLAGAVVLAGGYWSVAGVPPHSPGAAAAFGFAAASYVVGHLVASLAAMLWRLEPHAWDRELRRVLAEQATAGGLSNQGVGRSLAAAIRDTDDLPAPARVELIRTWLRRRGLDGRFELMNTNAWVSRNLTMSCAVLALFFVGTDLVAKHDARRLYATAIAVPAAGVFWLRTRRYQANAVDTLVFEVLALTRAPKRLVESSKP
jgi:hypothetical protein